MPFAVYIRVPEALGTKFGGALVDGTEVFPLKKNGFIDGSPENGNQYGEFRRSGEAMHAGKINPAPRCGGFTFKMNSTPVSYTHLTLPTK